MTQADKNNMQGLSTNYISPRWSGEVIDCSMPMTFDTYSVCYYNCLYCFAFFQKSHSCGENKYLTKTVRSVNINRIKQLFTGALSGNYEGISKGQLSFIPYIRARKVMQWGGLADGFDDFEKQYGISLQLLRFFDEIDYPLSISTKGTWWTKDERYMSLLRKHNHNWHFKVSIITMDPIKAAGVERGVDPPAERMEALRRIANVGCHVTLRLRPYVIGVSDDWKTTVLKAAEAGADSATIEFFCLEARADDRLKQKYKEISKFTGFDVWEYYKVNSRGSGYRRLNYEIKRPIITQMRDLCHSLGMRFYVSDAHHKEKSDACCCCGVPPEWNVCHGHFAEALQIAKSRDSGLVYWKDLEQEAHKIIGNVDIIGAEGFNIGSNKKRAQLWNQSLEDFLHNKWNNPKTLNSPYNYFSGILYPVGLDEDQNVIYKYNRKKAEKN